MAHPETPTLTETAAPDPSDALRAAPWRLSAGELAQAYATGALEPVGVLRAVLARHEKVQAHIHALVAVDEAGALAAAHASASRWRQGAPLSALDGVPLSVKDNIPVAGMPCRWGSRLYEDYRPARDESPVRRLRTGGAVLFAKTNVPEFTLQGYCGNALFGTTRNPWDGALTPGGSSGGAVAAVASGVGPLALGTDGGGSIRRPCALTGLAGLKPGTGCVERSGGLPEILPGLEVAGPIARTVGDLRRAMQMLAPGRGFDATGSPRAPRPLRIAFWPALPGRPVDPQVARGVAGAARALAAMGHAVAEAEAPAEIDRFNQQAWPVIAATGLAAVLRGLDDAGAQRLTPALAAMLETGRALGAVELFEAQQCMRRLRAAIGACLARTELVLTPSSAALPWPAGDTHPARIGGQPADGRGHAVFTAFVNACGLPALNLPAQPSGEGLPVGFQLIGRRGDEALLLAVGEAYEARHPWRARWPEPARP